MASGWSYVVPIAIVTTIYLGLGRRYSQRENIENSMSSYSSR